MFKSARRILTAILSATLVAGLLTPSIAAAQIPYLQLPAQSPKYAAIVVDANTGEVLYAKSADSPRFPASITKVMTLYLTFEALSEGRIHASDMITVSARAAAQAPTKLGLRPGEQISVDDAMRAIAVKSANDMAVALAEYLGGSEERFAALMTLRGQELGMTNTRYVNASGLPDNRQISSARDIAILSRAVMRDFPQYYSYFSIRSFTFRGQTMTNHNHLLGQMPGVDGLKTGFTSASGFNLAASATRDGKRLIAVVLGGSSVAGRDNHMEDLLDTGFDVMARRDRGETITVAQSLFEGPPQGGPVYRPTTEQGDSDQEGIQIVLADNPAAPGGSMAPIADPPAPLRAVAPKKTAPPKKKPAGEWGIQVGAFKDKGQARAELGRFKKRFDNLLDDAEGQVADKVGGYFRVQFDGMTADAARNACKTLKAKRQVCMVLAP
ncbi:D-alanyl-D-alanine carboxypeptidase (penicillin-binding protein 5/6) [Caulobacter ginsengisoli]|uniref:D-alanyl-D-alanine carboxypeptidase (Penicillin-binding protein 5/6) n=1 Tax=Caulobacter ginsengisoli TaxID=400775 RepID=A0ABU0ISQ8_9CAUL|nr:D-alanyl-D-alanine carboxypeptidase [Caulobacter ginsengisoli]MDQ0464069.1 D-alanyl-D-alanine carboxypeptidase (penicillin-binding protein 5/6) [Caulobacter ginsengisoli]